MKAQNDDLCGLLRILANARNDESGIDSSLATQAQNDEKKMSLLKALAEESIVLAMTIAI